MSEMTPADQTPKMLAELNAESMTIVNPVTGESLDVMEQCVSLTVEGRDTLADREAFEDCLSTFEMELPLRQRVWRRQGGRIESGTIHRVNIEDGTYDVAMDDHSGASFFARRHGIVRDVARNELETAPLLVLGEPAGGKTTFGKQLVTWTTRRSTQLVPLMVRVCDVARWWQSRETQEATVPCVWAFIRETWASKYPNVPLEIFERAKASKSLLLVLDGLDEAGNLSDRLEREIHDDYVQVSLVVTSRDTKSLDSSTFSRFRRVRVLQLDKDQIHAIATHRLGPVKAQDFLTQLTSSPALRRMAVNPLLLSVTLAVFEHPARLKNWHTHHHTFLPSEEDDEDSSDADDRTTAELNRGLVYSVALDSMLDNSLGDEAMCRRARRLFRAVAYLAHSYLGGKGTRDFDDGLVLEAIGRAPKLCPDVGMADMPTLRDWHHFADAAQRGRLPLLTWYSEHGVDKYRFAHLTFQEFLCAEQCIDLFDREKANDLAFQQRLQRQGRPASSRFASEFKTLVMGTQERVTECFHRGWWQQVLQMLSDLAHSKHRQLNLGRELLLDNGGFHLMACVGDRNVATLAALLRDARGVERAGCVNGGIGAAGIGVLFHSRWWFGALKELNLAGNLLDPLAATRLATALGAAGAPLEKIDVSWNRICIGTDRRPGFEKETFHSRTKNGGTLRNKLYLDYFHAAWIPDLSGLDALVSLVLTTPTLEVFDCRSNGLPVSAGPKLASLLQPGRLRHLCGIDLVKLGIHSTTTTAPLDDDDDAELKFGPRSEEDDVLRVGQVVMAKLRPGTRNFYVARILAVHPSGTYTVGFTDQGEGDDAAVVRVEMNHARKLIRAHGHRGPHPRLEAGGCFLLARALAMAAPQFRARLTNLVLAHQALAFDVSVWNTPVTGDISIAQELDLDNLDLPEENDVDLVGEDNNKGASSSASEDETAINPLGVLELLAVLQDCPRLEVVDLRDTIDLGTQLGAAIGAKALELQWKKVGLGSNFFDVRRLSTGERIKVKKTVKDAGLAGVVTMALNAKRIAISTTAVSSRSLDKVIETAAGRPKLKVFNDIDLVTLRSLSRTDDDEEETPSRGGYQSASELRFGSLALERASARLVLESIYKYGAPRLRVLDLANADLMPSVHPHPRTPELFGVGHLCNACATHHRLTVDLNLACQICDNDCCGAAWKSGDIVEDLAAALRASPNLEHLGLNGCCFTTMDGPVSAPPFQKLGAALATLQKLSYIDLRNNTWTGPHLTRWCAESMSSSAGTSETRRRQDDDDDDDDDLRGQHRWRRQQALHAIDSGDEAADVDDDDDGDDDETAQHLGERNDDSHAYSPKKLPLAVGWPFLARGLAKCVALNKVDVSEKVCVDVGRLAVKLDETDEIEANDFARKPLSNFSSEENGEDDKYSEDVTHDLASLVLFVDVLRFSPRIRRMPTKLTVTLDYFPAFCQHRAQGVLVPLLQHLDALTIKPSPNRLYSTPRLQQMFAHVRHLTLPLGGLRTGDLEVLDLDDPAEPARMRTSGDSYGVLVAAAMASAKNLVEVRAFGHSFGAATGDVVKAALGCGTLERFNGIGIRKKTLASPPLSPDGTRLDLHGQALTDVGATLLGHWFVGNRGQAATLTALDLRRTSLAPEGVAAVVSGLIGTATTLELLDLSNCDVGDLGMAKLAAYLKSNPGLRKLKLVGAKIPWSMTSAAQSFGLALEHNTNLAVLDLRTDVPAKLKENLERTFQKQPTCDLPYTCKLAFLFALRCRGFAFNDDVLGAIFTMVQTTRVLLGLKEHMAIADQLQDPSAPARDLIDRMDSGDLDILVEADIHEINAALADLDSDSQQDVMTAFQLISRRRRRPVQQQQQAEAAADDDLDDDDDEEEDDSDDDDDDDDDDDASSSIDDAPFPIGDLIGADGGLDIDDADDLDEDP